MISSFQPFFPTLSCKVRYRSFLDLREVHNIRCVTVVMVMHDWSSFCEVVLSDECSICDSNIFIVYFACRYYKSQISVGLISLLTITVASFNSAPRKKTLVCGCKLLGSEVVVEASCRSNDTKE